VSLTIAGALTPNLLKAVRAVNRPVGPRLERNPRFLPAVAANGAEHLALVSVTATTAAGAAVAVASAALGVASRRPAAGTAPGLVHEAPGRIEFLLACGKDERLAAVAAGQGLVCVGHADSSRKLLVGFRVSASRAWTACGSRATIGAGLRTEPRAMISDYGQGSQTSRRDLARLAGFDT